MSRRPRPCARCPLFANGFCGHLAKRISAQSDSCEFGRKAMNSAARRKRLAKSPAEQTKTVADRPAAAIPPGREGDRSPAALRRPAEKMSGLKVRLDNRIYISGPLEGDGIENYNRPAFFAAEERLRSRGWFVVNPQSIAAQFGTDGDLDESFRALHEWKRLDESLKNDRNAGAAEAMTPMSIISATTAKGRSYIARAVIDTCLAAVSTCDTIYMLKGWQRSLRAKQELEKALSCRLSVRLESEEGDEP